MSKIKHYPWLNLAIFSPLNTTYRENWIKSASHENLFGEKKAWATSDESKIQQAAFISLAHNLTLMLEREIEQREGFRDEKTEQRKAARIEKARVRITADERIFNPLVAGVRRVTKRSVQFIGWLQTCLEHHTRWTLAMAQLRPLMEGYLQ